MKKKTILFVSFFYIFLFNSFSLFGQEPFYWQLTDEDGLPSMTVYKVIQDKKGLIWIATSNGLCNFDGKFIRKIESSQLRDQEILKIQEGADGNIWGVNLAGQLFHSVGNHVVAIDSLGNNQLGKILDFHWVGENLFLGNRSLQDEIDYNQPEKLAKKVHLKILLYNARTKECTLPKQPDFRLSNTLAYISFSEYDAHILQYSLYNIATCIIGLINRDGKDSIISEYSQKNLGNIQTLSWNNFLFFLDKRKLDYSSLTNMLKFNLYTPEKVVTLEKNQNELFLILEKGIQIVDKQNNFATLYKNTSFNSAFRDREGNLWLSTNGKGIMIVPNEKVLFINQSNSIFKSDAVYSLNKIQEDFILLGKNDNTITKIGNNLELINYKLPIEVKVSSIVETSKNSFLICSNKGLIEANSNFNVFQNLFGGAYKTIYKSKKGEIYLGSSLYFSKIVPRKISPSGFISPSFLRTYGITESRDGLIWFGTSTGIFTYDGIKTTPFIDGKNKEQVPYNVSAMKSDSTGRIWATTLGHGVILMKNGQIEKVLDKNYGMPTNSFLCVFSEGNYTWLGSDMGVFRYDINTHEILHLNKYYGIPSNEILSLCTNHDNLLIGTSKGLTVLPFSTMKINTVAPNIHLLGLKINEIDRSVENTDYTLGYRENNLYIEYVSYQYHSKGDARYEYRIMELDTNWTMTTERSLRFPNLNTGHYHVEIRALNENGIHSTTPIQLHFFIKKPFWLEWWFYFGLLVIAGVSIWWYLRRKFSAQMKMEDLRMQALQAQMNPHFIFNSLNAIQHFLTVNDEDNAIKFLSRFARLIRTVFEYNKKKVITFGEELEMLEIYLSLEKLRFNDKVDIHLHVDELLNEQKEDIDLPPLLIQPMIENCFKHGLFHKKGKGNLWINFALIENNRLKCTIEDDGVGRKKSQEYSVWKGAYTSTGVKSTIERIKFWHLKNKTNVENYFTIEDLYEGIEAKGTRVTLIL